MHREQLREAALSLAAEGLGPAAVARRLDLPVTTVWNWLNRPRRLEAPQPCPRCDPDRGSPLDASYAYLLGQYLGDGHLVTSSRTPVLRIYATATYPRIVEEIDYAISAVRGAQPGHVRMTGVTSVQSYWNHWPCLFPQHGPGLKHRRAIALADWQREIVRNHPRELVRGLIHSDGCRTINRVTVRGTRYSYPRYFLSNESQDIQAIFTDALDQLGIEWRANRANSISIARKASVAALDAFIGPKA